MADFIVLRLTPAAPIDAATFANYLTGLTINVFDASFATPKAGMPGDPTLPIGFATFNAPAFVGFPAPLPPPPIVELPGGHHHRPAFHREHRRAVRHRRRHAVGRNRRHPVRRAAGGVSQRQSTARSPDSIPARRQPDDLRPRRLLRRADLHGWRRTCTGRISIPFRRRCQRVRHAAGRARLLRSRASICPPTAVSPRTTAC